MEVLLFALFFIVSLIFFIAGKDDFGRKGNKLKTELKDMETDHNESEVEPNKEIKEKVELK